MKRSRQEKRAEVRERSSKLHKATQQVRYTVSRQDPAHTGHLGDYVSLTYDNPFAGLLNGGLRNRVGVGEVTGVLPLLGVQGLRRRRRENNRAL